MLNGERRDGGPCALTLARAAARKGRGATVPCRQLKGSVAPSLMFGARRGAHALKLHAFSRPSAFRVKYE
jgi:hypothetical protein